MAEVGSAYVSILPSAKGFGRKLDTQVGGEIDSSGKKAGSRFGAGFKVGALAIVGGAFAAGKFLTGAVQQASDLSEAASKVGVVFGKQADQIKKAAKTSATAMGLSESAYLDATGSLGNLLVSLDIAPKKSANLSQQMVKLAGDLASFNNTSPEEALQALRSGLTGETEPLKRFGVNMNDATLKAQALKMGLIKSTKDALTPQNKALAAQALIMKQTKTAQGDFARTSGGLANQQRILSAQFADIKTKIGKAFLPVVTKIVTFFNTKLLPSFKNLGPAFETINTAVKPVIAAVRGFFDRFKQGGGADKAKKLLQQLGDFIKTKLAPAIAIGAKYFAEKLIPVILDVWAVIRDKFIPIVATLIQFWRDRIPEVIAAAKPAFDTIVSVVRDKLIPALGKIVDKFREWQPTIMRVTDVLLDIGKFILTKVIPPLAKFIGYIIEKGVPILLGVIDVGVQVVDWLLDFKNKLVAGATAAKEFFQGIKDKFTKAKEYVKGLPERIKTALGDLKELLKEAGKDVIRGLIKGITSMFDPLGRALGKVGQYIKDHKGPPRKDAVMLTPAGRLLMDGLIAGIDDGLNPLKRKLQVVSSAIRNGVDGGLTGSLNVAVAGGPLASAQAIARNQTAYLRAATAAGGQQLRGTLSIDRDGVAYIHGVSRREIRSSDATRRAADRAAALGGADFR